MSLLIVIELEDLIELPGPAAKAEADSEAPAEERDVVLSR